MKIKIVSFTKDGTKVSRKVIKVLKDKGYEVEAFGKYPDEIVEKLEESIYKFTKKAFEEQVHGIIFVGALGIAVRAIAPNIVSKGKDPGIIVIDDMERYVISVLSGHIGGANELTAYIAEKLRSTPVITTATDGHGVFAVDTWAVKNQCSILDISMIKYISSALLMGRKVGFISDYPVEGDLPPGLGYGSEYEVGICISSDINRRPFKKTLNLVPKEYILGIGCKKNTPFNKLKEILNNTLNKKDISVQQIRNVASINIKAKEEAILEYCKTEGIEFVTFSGEELLKVEGEFTSSAFVKSITGVDNVCERSAQKSGEDLGANLVLRKQSCDGVTVAISKINWRCRF